MKLIKDLHVVKVKSKNRSFQYYKKALFYCPACKKDVIRTKRSGLKAKTCGCSKIGDWGTRLYNVWNHMKKRCNNKKTKYYKDYGGRGITYCSDWEYYINFKNWAISNGYSDELEIDRIDNNGNYEPSNCRFVTREVNVQNRRMNKLNQQKVREIRRLFKTGKLIRSEIAKMYSVSWDLINNVTSGKSWSNIK